MSRDRAFEELWDRAPEANDHFDPARIAHLPPGARRYLAHALRPGAKLATAARLRMHGTIRLGDTWHPFDAEQVLRWDRGFVWRARTQMKHLPVRGSDRWVDGAGSMRWKMLGILPVATGEGPDVTRSAAGRFNAESIWLPAVLLGDGVTWSERDATHPTVAVRAHGEDSLLQIVIGEEGAIRQVQLERWGNPEGGASHAAIFGGFMDEERTFEGVTVPTRLRMGWYFGTPRFETEGEFFRATIDAIEYR